MELVEPVKVEARDGWRIWVAFADGVSGEIDLSDMAEESICAAWRDPAFWRNVRITDYRAVAWSEDIELCAELAVHGPDRADVTGDVPEQHRYHGECLSS